MLQYIVYGFVLGFAIRLFFRNSIGGGDFRLWFPLILIGAAAILTLNDPEIVRLLRAGSLGKSLLATIGPVVLLVLACFMSLYQVQHFLLHLLLLPFKSKARTLTLHPLNWGAPPILMAYPGIEALLLAKAFRKPDEMPPLFEKFKLRAKESFNERYVRIAEEIFGNLNLDCRINEREVLQKAKSARVAAGDIDVLMRKWHYYEHERNHRLKGLTTVKEAMGRRLGEISSELLPVFFLEQKEIVSRYRVVAPETNED